MPYNRSRLSAFRPQCLRRIRRHDWRYVHCSTLQTNVTEIFFPLVDEDDDETTVMAATVRELPSRDMDGLWDR